jgi:hypothetical protein
MNTKTLNTIITKVITTADDLVVAPSLCGMIYLNPILLAMNVAK